MKIIIINAIKTLYAFLRFELHQCRIKWQLYSNVIFLDDNPEGIVMVTTTQGISVGTGSTQTATIFFFQNFVQPVEALCNGPSAKKSSSFETLVIQNVSNANDLKVKLNEIIAAGKNYEFDVSSCIKALLNSHDQIIVLLTVQAVSELAKCEIKRDTYAQKDIIEPILTILSKEITLDKIELMKHCCRALGNLCCDCDTSRNILLENNGVRILINILKTTIENNTTMSLGEIELVAVKTLLNYAIGGQEYSDSLVKGDLIEYATKILTVESFKEVMEEDLVSTILTLLSVINDNDPEILFKPDVNMAVLNVLRETTNIEVSELALEHLHTQAEHDSVKTLLAKDGGVNLVCLRLEQLIQHKSDLAQDSEVEAVMKQACDLIIIVLTGDEAMHILYKKGSGEVYSTMVRWLDSTNHQLLVTAVLAIGNFARRDDYCMQMMTDHIFDKLLDIFELYHGLSIEMQNNPDGPRTVDEGTVTKLQHATLSALRNLSVPAANKAAAGARASQALVRALQHVTDAHVAYKLLAAVRMLLDGQESVARLLVCSPGLAQVSAWGAAGHAGAGAEAPRLLARAARLLPRDLLPRLLAADCVARLVDMLLASHSVMQNEAILALTLMAAELFDGPEEADLCELLLKAEIGKHVAVLIETNCAKMPAEVAENLVAFLDVTSKNDRILSDYREARVDEAAKKFVEAREDLSDVVKLCMNNVIGIISAMRGEK